MINLKYKFIMFVLIKMSEKFQFYENYIEEVKPKNFSDPKNKIEEQTIDFYKKNKNNPDSIQSLKELLKSQNNENLQLFELLKVKKELILEESRSNIDKIRLENYEKIVNQIKKNLIDIQKTKDENFDNTGKLIDDLYGFFGGNTAENIYKTSFDNIKNQASQLLNKILKNINKRNLSEQDKTKYKNLVTELIKISKVELKPTIKSDLTIEEYKKAPERIKLAKQGVKGEVNGIISGTKNIITGTVDLLKFIIKYPLFKKYRKEINEEIGKIYNFCVENGITGLKDKIGYILVKEVERIGKLPKEEQSKEVGKISGNVIAGLLSIKATEFLLGKLKKIKTLKNMNKNIPGVINEGVEKVGETESLYNKKGYEFLRKHKDILGKNLDINDVVGEGDNAIILKHPSKNDKIIKITKEGKNKDKIDLEYNNHKFFYETLEKGKIEYKGLLAENIKIPKIRKGVGINDGYFIMEKIEGQSLKTKFYIEYYNKELKKLGFTDEFLRGLNDGGFEILMEKNKLYGIPKFVLDNDYDSKILIKEISKYFNKHLYGTELGNTLDFLEWKGLKHTDLHPGNIMLDNNGNFYIIDFGKAEIIKK